MLARARTFTLEGLNARAVSVEIDIRPGLPAFAIVGLADAAVREARDRVHAALLNSGFQFPARRITANLAPADVPKIGPGFDLALACGILAASGQIPSELLDTHALFGELSLDGEVRACHGTLAVAEATKKAGLAMLVLSPQRAREATLVEGLPVSVVERLSSAARVLSGGAGDRLPEQSCEQPSTPRHGPDLSDVRGQAQAVRALVVAAAGAHNCLLSGSPGTGKTMLAGRLPSILPPLERSEAIEVMRIHSATGKLAGNELLTDRPFRAPHHTITTAGLIGGARRGWVGEAVLAHNGVLFLDELSEFARPTLEALRQPLEEGRVSIVRARHSAVYPARFMLIAATNPCPCGYAGERERCACREVDLARHRRRLSGPLLDRIDLLVHVERTAADHLADKPSLSSARARGAGDRSPPASSQEAASRGRSRQRADGCADAAQTSQARRAGRADNGSRPGTRSAERARTAPRSARRTYVCRLAGPRACRRRADLTSARTATRGRSLRA